MILKGAGIVIDDAIGGGDLGADDGVDLVRGGNSVQAGRNQDSHAF